MPKFESSSSLGDSFSVPYFKVISESKDLTFTPKFLMKVRDCFKTNIDKKTKIHLILLI